MRLANSAVRITSIVRLLDGSRGARRARRHECFCSALQAYQWDFLHTKDEWSRLQISGPLSIDIWAVTSTHWLVPEGRKPEAFHKGRRYSIIKGKEGSKGVRIVEILEDASNSYCKELCKMSQTRQPDRDLRCIASRWARHQPEVAALCHRQAPFSKPCVAYSRGFSVFLDAN